MMNGKTLFIIPVYFQSKESHAKNYERKFEKYLMRFKKIFENKFDEVREKSVDFRKQFDTYNWYSWKYTQIIHIVEINYEPNNLKAYLYSVQCRRFRSLMNKKIFIYQGKIGDVTFFESYEDKNKILSDIERFIKELRFRFKKYYVDTTLVENLIPLIDFRNLKNYYF